MCRISCMTEAEEFIKESKMKPTQISGSRV